MQVVQPTPRALASLLTNNESSTEPVESPLPRVIMSEVERIESPPSHCRVEMNELVLPSHTNSLGTIFGGVLMSWIDVCAAMSAQKHARSTVVTASMDQLDFIAPIHLGEIVNLRATVNAVGRTSMEVGVRVETDDPRTGIRSHVASAYLTFVSIDDKGHTQVVPLLSPLNDAERLRAAEASIRRQHRLDVAAERRTLRGE